MLPELLLVCYLTFKFIECSRRSQLSTSFSNPIDDDEQNKSSKTGKLVPKKLPPRSESLPPGYWMYHPFPILNGINGKQFPSADTNHSPNNLRTFFCCKKGQSGGTELYFMEVARDVNFLFHFPDDSLGSVSVFKECVLATSGREFTRFNLGPDSVDDPRYRLDHVLSEEDVPHEDDTIVTGKLVSDTLGYILTRMGLFICITWAPFLVKRVFQNVSNFAAEGNLLALVTTDEPRGLRVFEDNNERAFFMKTRNEKLLKFADTANIVVIDRQYILFYTKSQAKLLNTNMRYFDDIPVGADMMYFEDPWLLALDGTTFTKYDIKENALQYYKFEGAVRVIPDKRWSSFALHHSEILDYFPYIQYVSRNVDQELNIASQALEYILPKVLIQLVQSYLPGFSPEIPKSPAEVFATLTSIRIRRENDLSAREPRIIATDGIYTAIVEEDSNSSWAASSNSLKRSTAW